MATLIYVQRMPAEEDKEGRTFIVNLDEVESIVPTSAARGVTLLFRSGRKVVVDTTLSDIMITWAKARNPHLD